MEPTHSLPQAGITHPLIDDLVTGARKAITDDKLLAMYLGGSIATGDFDESTSDLDFLVVLKSQPTDAEVEQLASLHDQVRFADKNRLYRNYEGDYLSLEQTQNPKTADMKAPHLGTDGHFNIEDHGPATIIDLWKIRKSGFTVFGPTPSETIAGLTTEDLLDASRALYKSWWEPKLQRHEPMDSEYQAYAVLTMARILYTLANRTIASKKVAADWCTSTHPQFSTLIAEARSWLPGKNLDQLHGVYELISFAGSFAEESSASSSN